MSKSKGSSVDTSLIKKPYLKETYTSQQLLEIAKCTDRINGPLYFITNYFHIQHPTLGAMLLQLHDYQLDMLDLYHANRKSVTMASRQMGKCFSYGTVVTIRNNISNKIYRLPIEVFHEYEKCKKENRPLPDISIFEQR